ncbi:phosphatase PAP2 family protein [Luteolibacter ambystomatis]|uniref:Phosphatase PAP2 family protein n=1 Tax=Luteolibacter ambystomatis TaxID=2824561 RepID=A0A975G6M3_9BACT|nr:phosphatase PAP2 family protein [Luteolibacter ambystomatis]QUE49777.1 phosphatase PAP2 family protein [Luteolibacter ambystomatis]
MTDPRNTPPSWLRLLVLPTIVALAAMGWLAWSGWDLKLQQLAFDFDLRRWKYGEEDPWLWLFQYGPLPMLVMGFAFLLSLFAGLAFPKLARFMKPSLFLILSIAISSGLISNVLLKDRWGRPRPSQVDGFGLMTDVQGMPYQSALRPAFGQDGKSFPCGHATTGFGLAGLGFILWRRRRKTALAIFTASYGYGILIGIARMLQGGHFASDVIGAALVCHATQAVLYRCMHLYEQPEWGYHPGRSRWGTAVGIGIPAVGLAVFAALLGTPYHEPMNIAAETLAKVDQDATTVKIESFGKTRLDVGPETRCRGVIKGFGLPRSRVKFALQTRGNVTRFFQIERGWFTELGQDLLITLPAKRGLTVELSAPEREASWELDLTRAGEDLGQSWTLHGGPRHHPVILLNQDSPVLVQHLAPTAQSPVVVFKGRGETPIRITVDGPLDPDLRILPPAMAVQ